MKMMGAEAGKCDDGGGINIKGDTTVLNFGDAESKAGGVIKKYLPHAAMLLIGLLAPSFLPLAKDAFALLSKPAAVTQPAPTQPTVPPAIVLPTVPSLPQPIQQPLPPSTAVSPENWKLDLQVNNPGQ